MSLRKKGSMDVFKRDLIVIASKDISGYVLEKCGAEVDFLEIAELVNYNLGGYIVTDSDEESFVFEEDDLYE